MKTFHFNHNDWCTVTLTKAGAEHINAKRKAFCDAYPYFREKYTLREDWEEGEVYRSQFWSLIQDFHEMMCIGAEPPFLMGDIKVESSLEN